MFYVFQNCKRVINIIRETENAIDSILDTANMVQHVVDRIIKIKEKYPIHNIVTDLQRDKEMLFEVDEYKIPLEDAITELIWDLELLAIKLEEL